MENIYDDNLNDNTAHPQVVSDFVASLLNANQYMIAKGFVSMVSV